jgi:hypothetical protein
MHKIARSTELTVYTCPQVTHSSTYSSDMAKCHSLSIACDNKLLQATRLHFASLVNDQQR